jgi:hypothetical protein
MALIVFVAAALLTIGRQAAAQAADGTVTGEITNGTSGAEVPTGIVVTLHVFSGMEEQDTYTTTLTVGNSYRFAGVAFEEGQTLVARTVHDGLTYVSEFATTQPDQLEVQLPITIYETTDEPDSVAIEQLHIFANRMGEQIQVGQYCLISNSSDRTYMGQVKPGSDERTTWSVVLPDGTQNLRFEGGELGGRFIALDDGFADTRPVLPGTTSIEASFTYDLPYSDGLSLEQVFDIPVNAAVVVLPEGDLALRGAQLSAEEMLETQMGPALSYTAGPLRPGETLAFAIVPQASVSPATQRTQPSNGLVVGIASLAVAGMAVYWMWRPPAPGSVPSELRAEVEAIAALDRDYEAGAVEEGRYRQRRKALKQRLSARLSDG